MSTINLHFTPHPFAVGAFRACVVALLSMILNACVFAPGMSAGKRLPTLSTKANQGTAPAEAQATLIPITPALLQSQRMALPSKANGEVMNLFGTSVTYTIGIGDVLNVIVWDHPEITPITGTTDGAGVTTAPGFTVGAQGSIQFPYVGSVRVRGLSEQQAREEITASLSRYFKNPQVTVQIQAYRSGRIYVEGDVRTPGLQALNDIPATLPLVLGRAGSLLPTADRSGVALTRQGKTTVLDLRQLVAQGIDLSSIVLRDGDSLFVPTGEDSKVFILGEVLKAGPQSLRNGKLTLNEALGQAGGIDPLSGDARQIYVVRYGESGMADIYHLDANSAAAYAMSAGFRLQASDVVFVDPAPLVNWNRVISLILPSARGVRLGQDISDR